MKGANWGKVGAKYLNASSKLGMRMGVAGLGVTVVDGFTNSNGWQNHQNGASLRKACGEGTSA